MEYKLVCEDTTNETEQQINYWAAQGFELKEVKVSDCNNSPTGVTFLAVLTK